MEKIGFIGLGLMGTPMVRRLLAAGHPVRVWNRSPAKAEALAEHGAVVCHDAASLARDVDIVMLCLADGAAVRQVVLGGGGVAAGGQPGKLLVDFSSIEPSQTRDIAARLFSGCGMHWVDAPVSGGVTGAESGRLVIMAGGREEDVARLTPIAQLLGQRLTRMGELGAGQVTKVCNQLIVAANALLIAEAVALAGKAGVDASLLAPALEGGFADSQPLQILAPRMAEGRFEPVAWKVSTLLKDLDNAVKLAREAGAGTPLAALADQLMRLHALRGFADADLSSVIASYREYAC